MWVILELNQEKLFWRGKISINNCYVCMCLFQIKSGVSEFVFGVWTKKMKKKMQAADILREMLMFASVCWIFELIEIVFCMLVTYFKVLILTVFKLFMSFQVAR